MLTLTTALHPLKVHEVIGSNNTALKQEWTQGNDVLRTGLEASTELALQQWYKVFDAKAERMKAHYTGKWSEGYTNPYCYSLGYPGHLVQYSQYYLNLRITLRTYKPSSIHRAGRGSIARPDADGGCSGRCTCYMY